MRQELQMFESILVVGALRGDSFVKRADDAGAPPGLIDTVTNYVSSHIDKDHPVKSVLDLLQPGVLTLMGFPWIALLCESFGINISSIFSTIKSGVESLIGDGKQTDSNSVMSMVWSAISSFLGLETKSEMTLQEAIIFKTSVDAFIKAHPDFAVSKPRIKIKIAAGLTDIVKGQVGKSLFAIVKWIVLALLASAGFMIGKDAVHAIMNKPSSPAGTPPATPANPTNSVELEVNPSYSEENYNDSISSWTIPGSPSGIGQIILSWVGDIYPQLANYNVLVSSTSGYNKVVNEIKQANAANKLGFVSMPRQYKSRKQVIDTFIPEIQNKLNQMAAGAAK